MRDETVPVRSAAPLSGGIGDRPSTFGASASTLSLETVHRACQGDRDAQESVFREYVAPLARFANGLLPTHLRRLTDHHDVVQDVLTRTARHLGRIECVDDGALLAYLRRAIRHRVVDEIRRVRRLPITSVLPDEWPTQAQSPLEAAIAAQNDRRMRAALSCLGRRERAALLLRFTDASYEDIADRLAFPTPNAARVAVRRAAQRVRKTLELTAMPGRATRGHAPRSTRQRRTSARS